MLTRTPTYNVGVSSITNGTGTIYTVPAGKLLHLTAVYAGIYQGGTPATGSWRVKAKIDGAALSDLIYLEAQATAGAPHVAFSGLDVHVLAGDTVTAVSSGLSGASFVGGFVGWLENVA